MKRNFVGVIDVGEQGGLNTPVTTPRYLAVPKGETTTIRIKVIKSNGAPANLLDTDTATLRVKKQSFAPMRAGEGFKLTASPAADEAGVFEFEISSGRTSNMLEARYVWDVWLDRASGDSFQIVGMGMFDLSASSRC